MVTLTCDECRATVHLPRERQHGYAAFPDQWRRDYLGGPSDSDPLAYHGVAFEFCSPACRDKLVARMVATVSIDPKDHRNDRR